MVEEEALGYMFQPGTTISKHAELVTVLRKTHDIYCGISKKKIALIPGDPPGRTDTETYIALPIEDPRADLILKHEWQHIFFGTDLRARALFAKRLLQELLAGHPHRNNPALCFEIERLIHVVANGLDDLRVSSLWFPLYPGSATEIQDRWRETILSSTRFRTDIVHYLMGIGLGLQEQMPRSSWAPWAPLLSAWAESVKGRPFATVLIATRQIITSVVDDIVRDFRAEPVPPQMNGPMRQQTAGMAPVGDAVPLRQLLSRGEAGFDNAAQADAVDALRSMSAPALAKAPEKKELMDTVMPDTPDPNPVHTQQMVQAAMGMLDDVEVASLLEEDHAELQEVVKSLQAQGDQGAQKDSRLTAA